MVWVSLSARILINVEALNMVESIGNYTRHRRAPLIVFDPDERKYVVKYVPAVSGESIAHGYQEVLAKVAEKYGISVCSRCKRGEFTKRGEISHLRDDKLKEPKKVEELTDFEISVIEKCIVEDVGGFMFPGTLPAKRTSCIYFGYLLPALEDFTASALEPQFHVRYSIKAKKGEQAIYYVETGSSVYVLSAALDVSKIGRTSMIEKKDAVTDRKKRVNASIEALYLLIVHGQFGAKRTRFLPGYNILSMVASVSQRLPFMVKPGHNRKYIKETVKAAFSFNNITGEAVKVFAYIGESDRKSNVEEPELKGDYGKVSVVMKDSPDEIFEEIKRVVSEWELKK